ncbi:hypothetical protein MAPG_08505 [Magnaporthiopsis poae ATCC 64411]|uniref:aldehyde dehydrogenase (NAD(+)) n=1 Tax=Magnaporthiopsis poae (strain ATCC 64411 / 73-15) TaxID=644358 RepID=A0A0C4E7J2_MAGP6|nr:hypothetical protein MAPG_08505 [Magnaporthiopsis poae ATCC 64411]
MASDSIVRPRMLIGGELLETSSDKKTFDIFSPSNVKIKIAEVPEATEDDTNRAVAAAARAFPAWSETAAEVRGNYLRKLAELMRENGPELARLEAISMGRPVTTYFDAEYAATRLELFAGAWPHMQGHSSINSPGYVSMTLRQPFGVVAGILPWNVPLPMFAAKAGPALVSGNCIIIKSSEKAPLAIAKLGELVVQAGFPAGVLNIISGHGQPSGARLARHPDIRALSFTGSSRTGRLIQIAAAESNLKHVTLELGGKSPAIVFADADLQRAAAQVAASVQFNSGQVCVANSRAYVEKSVANEFIGLVKQALTAMTVAGDPLDPKTTHGPQADRLQYDTVLSYIESGKKASGELALGGNGSLDESGGLFVEPTVFVSQPEDSPVVKNEIFGPVIVINTFEEEAEVLKLANDSEYGLWAAVYTRDLSRALRVSKALESGTVSVNCTVPTAASPDMPFGGYKASGQGREGIRDSIDNFCETKTVIIKVDEL